MKLAKSLLLGSAAGFAAVAGANAADLPAKKAAPVEYVRVCSSHGEGFFYIPGTETCLRVSGRVRADYVYGQPFERSVDSNGFRTRGRIQLDARTSTAYGLLRSVVRFEITRNSGTQLTSTGKITTSPDVNEAFIQFGGLTAGRVTSFFDNGDLPTEHMGTLRFSDAPDVGLLAYTFTFGNGFSATLSLEDGLDRRNGTQALAYAGQRVPDVVGNIKYTGTWGTAQLSAAGHQIRSDNLFVAANGFSDFPDTEYGFAVTGQVGVNLPMLAPGDAAWIAVTYTHGALGYITGGAGDDFTDGTLTAPTIDAFFNPATGNVSLSTAWSVAGGLTHYWTPQIRQSVFGSYASFSYSAAANQAGIPDFNEWRVGTNVFWQPVSGLNIGVEALYARLDPRGRVVLPLGSNESSWEGRLRVQRDF